MPGQVERIAAAETRYRRGHRSQVISRRMALARTNVMAIHICCGDARASLQIVELDDTAKRKQ